MSIQKPGRSRSCFPASTKTKSSTRWIGRTWPRGFVKTACSKRLRTCGSITCSRITRWNGSDVALPMRFLGLVTRTQLVEMLAHTYAEAKNIDPNEAYTRLETSLKQLRLIE